MTRFLCAAAAAFALTTTAAGAADAPARPPALTSAQLMAGQLEAMRRLSILDGAWRGPAWSMPAPGAERTDFTHTMRVGPALDGGVRVIDSRSYRADGSLMWQAFNLITYDAQAAKYSINGRAEGRNGNFDFQLTADGYVWSLGGGGHGLRYTGVVRDGVWTETTESLAPDRAPIKIAEMRLQRIGDTAWPSAGGVPPR